MLLDIESPIRCVNKTHDLRKTMGSPMSTLQYTSINNSILSSAQESRNVAKVNSRLTTSSYQKPELRNKTKLSTSFAVSPKNSIESKSMSYYLNNYLHSKKDESCYQEFLQSKERMNKFPKTPQGGSRFFAKRSGASTSLGSALFS